MFDILLQADTTGAAKAISAETESVWGVLIKGGLQSPSSFSLKD